MSVIKGITAFIFWFIGIFSTLFLLIPLIQEKDLARYSYRPGLLLLLLVIAGIAASLLSKRFFKTITIAKIQEQNIPEGKRWVMPTRETLTYNNRTTHGTAHFLSDDQKEAATSMLNGLYFGGGFTHMGKGHVITVAPPQTGKDAALYTPTLLMPLANYKRSYVVFDPKGSLARRTALSHAKRGHKVFVFDPFNVQSVLRRKQGIKIACFNPMELLHLMDSNIVSATSRMVRVMLPDPEKESDNDFTANARDFLEYVVLHVMTFPIYQFERNLITVSRLINQSDWAALFTEMLDNSALNGLVSDGARKYANLHLQSERTFGSMLFSLNRAIAWLKDPQMQASLMKSDFDPFELERGGITLFINLPFDVIEQFNVWTRLVFDFCLRANAKPSVSPKQFVYYLIDEFASLGRFDEIKKAMAQYAEYNIRIWVAIQSLHQLDRIYGKDGRSEILELCSAFLAFKINDYESAEYISKRLGGMTDSYFTNNFTEGETDQSGESFTNGQHPSTSRNTGLSKHRGSGKTEVFIERKLLTPDEVMREDHIIAMVNGIGNMRLRRWFYFKEPKDKYERYWHHNFNKQLKLGEDDDSITYEMIENNGNGSLSLN